MATTTPPQNGTVAPGVQRQPTLQEVKEEVKKYNFFNPKLRQQANENGDIYGKEKVEQTRAGWHVTSAPGERPYLTHVKLMAASWPQLGLLSDFMEIGTSPVRWTDLNSPKPERKADREERISRTNVTRLDYLRSSKIKKDTYTTSESLRKSHETSTSAPKDPRNFRLFIIEDLSRDVIEYFGSRYDIDPQFFRDQIFDYTWYNSRDRWVNPPRLVAVTKHRPWFQMRYTTARYFREASEFKKGFDEAQKFNVLRRPDDDLNTRALWDQAEAKVGLTRTRISFWMQREGTDGAVGIMLVDPTIKEGYPLWRGYGNWEKIPSMDNDGPPAGPPQQSAYEDIVYWAQRLSAFSESCTAPNPTANFHVPIQALLYYVSSEWLTISEYIKTRLGQIEWEVSYPSHFLGKEVTIDVALDKLHVWRRLVPLYREMLSETLHRVFNFPCHTLAMADPNTSTGTAAMASTSNPPGPPPHCQCPLHNPTSTTKGPIGSMREDFALILSYMEEYQQRIDRLTSVVTAIISIGDSRTSQADNRNVARLTWLATFFIPMSFVTGLFSMTEDIGTLKGTVKWYFAVALPLSFISLGLAVVLTLPGVLRAWERQSKRWRKWFEREDRDKKNN